MYKPKDLLDPNELQLLAKIDAAVRRKIHCNGERTVSADDIFKTGQFMQQVSVMEENFKAVVERIREQNDLMECFVETYPKWRNNRKMCIAKLEQIAKSLDKDRHNFNMSKMFGYCLSCAGGAGLLASGINIDCTAPLGIASGTLTTTGAGIVLGTSITETARLARKVKKAKRLIRKDQIFFQSIRECLNHADEIQESLINVLDIDIMKGIAGIIRQFIQKAVKINDDHKRLKFIEKNVKYYIDKQVKDSYDLSAAALITFIRIFTTVLLLLCKTENRFVFDFASMATKSVVVVALLVENSINAFGLASKLAVDSAQLLRVATGVVGMTLDTVGIVKTSVDIYRKSLSPESKKITQATIQLSEEADILDIVYKRLSAAEE